MCASASIRADGLVAVVRVRDAVAAGATAPAGDEAATACWCRMTLFAVPSSHGSIDAPVSISRTCRRRQVSRKTDEVRSSASDHEPVRRKQWLSTAST